MEHMLAPLVGDAPVVAFVGLCKNAGKTTALCRLMAELEGERLALTSAGRDGERTDVVTGTEKPAIWVSAGTLFATAKGLLPLCDVTVQVLGTVGTATPLGQVAIFRALSDGYIQLAGPSAVGQMEELAHAFRALGADRLLIDGAAGRRSLAAAGTGGTAILCVGASMEGTAQTVAAEAAHVCALFAAPRPDGAGLRGALEETAARFALFSPDGAPLPLETDGGGSPLWGRLPRTPCVLWAAGGVTSPMLRALAQRGAPITVAAPDATHFLVDREAAGLFARRGGALRVRRELTIAALCANPWSAYGRHLERGELLAALRAAVSLPVVDVMEGEKP